MPGKVGRLVVLSGVALGALVAASPAFAGAFGLREQSATGQGMSFAGMAAGGGDTISGMFWNPAVVNQVEHFQGEQHITAVLPSSKIDVNGGPAFSAGGDSGNIGESAFLTAGYSAYRLTDQIAIGVSINTPFGLKTKADEDWGGQIFGTSSRARSVNVSPTIGYKINDQLSVAVGVQVQWFDIRLKQAVPSLAAPTGGRIAKLDGDDFGVGFTAGLTYQPVEGTEIGVGFRSSVKHTLKGDFYGPGPDANIKATVKLPEQLSVGIRQRVTSDLTVLAGLEWTNWSRLGTIPIRGAALPALPFEYKDGWFFSGGLEYAYSPDLTLRTGVGYEKSPITNKTRNVRIPDDDRWWLSAGGTYNVNEKLTFDLGYSYVFVPGKSKIDINPGDDDASPIQAFIGPFSATAKSDVHIISAAVRYKFGSEAPAALVTKY